MKYLTTEELEAGLDKIRQSPKDRGVLQLIVRRPGSNEREVLAEAELNLSEGLAGDSWRARGNARAGNGAPNPDTQLNIMNARAVALIAHEKARWPLAGDQLYIDLDLSDENLPAGTCLAIGTAVIEVTAQPHTGCQKFQDRFGTEARKFVNSPEGKRLHLRGICAKVVQPGSIRTGDAIKKMPRPASDVPIPP